MDYDFSELEKLHQDTFNKAIKILTDHFDTYVQDEQAKLKALTQIKKDTEVLIKTFGGSNDNQQ